jgi:hypothetical protein
MCSEHIKMNLEQMLLTSFSMSSMKNTDTMTDAIKMMGVMGLLYFAKEARVLLPQLFDMTFRQCRKRAVDMVQDKVICKPDVSQIVFTRDYESNDESCEIIDALIDYLCDCVKSLAYTNFYIFDSTEEFVITDEISGKFVSKSFGENGIRQVTFAIRSKTMSIRELRLWCMRILEDYKERRQSGFLLDRYYFNETTKQNRTHFTMTKFDTNKRLDNLFGEHIELVKKRVNMFIHNKKWYTDKGVPHSLGLILQGIPGTGKTSLIKAIAKDTNRHIVNLTLRKNTTVNYLHKLFFDNQLPSADGKMIRIPVSERVYVIEDADCLTDILLSREFQEEKKEEDDENMTYEQRKAIEVQKSNSDEIATLSHILNILDGVLETPGRIIIMTTNHFERLDSALKRPGRFDLIIEFTHCTKQTISQMINHFLDITVNPEDLNEYDKKLTPAEVQNLLLSNTTSEGVDILELFRNHFS